MFFGSNLRTTDKPCRPIDRSKLPAALEEVEIKHTNRMPFAEASFYCAQYVTSVRCDYGEGHTALEIQLLPTMVIGSTQRDIIVIVNRKLLTNCFPLNKIEKGFLH